MRYEQDNRSGKIIKFKWTRHKEGAKPFKEGSRELEDIHATLYDNGIMHDLVREYVPWVDDR